MNKMTVWTRWWKRIRPTALACAVAFLTWGAAGAALPDGYGYTEKVGDYTWTFSVINGKAEIGVRDANGSEQWNKAVSPYPSGALTVPSTLGGCPVTKLGYCAFCWCSEVEQFALPDTLREIGNYAFYDCQGLTSLVIPEGVTNVLFCACEYDTQLRSVTFPTSIQGVGYSVFYGCSQLSAVFFNGNAPTNLNANFYYDTPDDLVTFVRSGSTGWQTAGSSALPEAWPTGSYSARDIRTWTTYPEPCWRVRFDIGDVATCVGGGDIEQIVYDGSAAYAPQLYLRTGYTFDCWDKDFSCVTNGLTVTAVYRYGGRLLDGWNYTETVDGYTWTFSVVNGNAEIGVRDQYGNEQWEKAISPEPSGALSVPATLGGCPVTRLGYAALYDCDNVRQIILPDSMKDIGSYAVQSSGNLQSISIPAAVTNIGVRAFAYCSSLRNLRVSLDNAWYSSDDGVLYDKNKTELIFWPRAKRIELPTTLRNVRPTACYDNDATSGETLVLPSAVTNIGSQAFYCCRLGGLELNEGLQAIGDYAFGSNYKLRAVVIPSTVNRMEYDVFSSCNNLSSVFFRGNAPTSVSDYLYNGTSTNLATYVREGSTGWEMAGSSTLPATWPTDSDYSRAICTWTTYPDVSWCVRFDLGTEATRVGGGALEQDVRENEAAAEPLLSVRPGYAFCGWDADFSEVINNMIVHAVYLETGTAFAKNLTASVTPAWSHTVTLEYDGYADASTNRFIRVYVLCNGAWYYVPADRITGDLSAGKGHHALTVDASELDLEPGETVFRLSAYEKSSAGVSIVDADGWTEANGVWRSRAIGDGERTSLRATVEGAGEVAFAWATSSERNYDLLVCHVDGEERESISGETDWTNVVVTIDGSRTHEITWTYRKDDSVSSGKDCGWVEILGDVSGFVGNQLVTATFDEPTIVLEPEYREDATVELVADDGEATIYCTFDGTVPTRASTVYSGPVSWTEFRKMKAVAICDDANWSEVIDGSEYVRINLDPALGEVDVTTILRWVGEPYCDLPEAWRNDCSFVGWTPYEWDLTGEDAIAAEDPVSYADDEDDEEDEDGLTLYAAWDRATEDVLDPTYSLESLELVWDTCLRRCRTQSGWCEYVTFSEYGCCSFIEPHSTNVILSVDFSGAGVLRLTYPQTDQKPLMGCLDGVWQMVGTEVRALVDESHHLELAYVNPYDWSSWAQYCLCAMEWVPAPDEVKVFFNACGGTASCDSLTCVPGTTYGTLPTVAARSGYEFLGWYTDAEDGYRVTETSLVDFTAPILYARCRTTLATALNGAEGSLVFSSAGPTGWTGLSGKTHDGIAAAASGTLEEGETNTLRTTVSGRGVLSFWWRNADEETTSLELTVDGVAMPLRTDADGWRRLGAYEEDEACSPWRHFTLAVKTAGAHAIAWSVTGANAEQVCVDEVAWQPDAGLTDVLAWAHSARQARRNLPGDADTMIDAYTQRIRANGQDYAAYVLRAVVRLKKLTENTALRALAKRCGYEWNDDWTSLIGAFDPKTAPETNAAVDEFAKAVLPALGDMLDDLGVVPEDWEGMVALDADEFPVDETVYLDAADVTLARSFLTGVVASIELAQGYDATLDHQKLSDEIVTATNRQRLVVAPFQGSWSRHARSRLTESNCVGFVRVAANGLKLLIDFQLPQNLPDACSRAQFGGYLRFAPGEAARAQGLDIPDWLDLDFSRDSDDGSYSAWGWVRGYGNRRPISCEQKDGHLYLTIDCGKKMSSGSTACSPEDDEEDEEDAITSLNGLSLQYAVLYWEDCEWEERVFHLRSDGHEYAPSLMAENVLAAHPQCLSRIRDYTKLAAAKADYRECFGLYETADRLFRGRTDDNLHFFEYDAEDADRWETALKQNRLAKAALDGFVTVDTYDYLKYGRSSQEPETFDVTLKPLFEGKILRKLLLPFSGDLPVLSAIPDITFAGSCPDWTTANRMPWLGRIVGLWNAGTTVPDDAEDEEDTEPMVETISTSDITMAYTAVKAQVMNGCVLKGGEVVGSIQLKVGKVAKGQCKISGTIQLFNGQKCALTGTKVTAGVGTLAATVAVKKLGSLKIVVGGSAFAGDVGAYHVQSGALGLGGKSAFKVSVEGVPSAIGGAAVQGDLLPETEPFTVKGGKTFVFAKAAGVKVKNGVLVITTAGGKTNMSGIKLSYDAKKGTFKGSFNIYAIDSSAAKPKLKKFSAKVVGAMIGGAGWGEATCTKCPGRTWKVSVE